MRRAAFILVPLLALAGCTLNQAYPKTEVKGYIGGQPFSFAAPKDYDVEGFDASMDTNGSLHIHVSKLTASLSVTNLNAVANGQSQIMTATASAIQSTAKTITETAAAIAAQAAKSP